MALLLEDCGFRVSSTNSGEQALRELREDLPDLVISDVRMPGVGGIELARMLRADGETRNIPMILISGFDERAARVIGLELGADDFIAKPIDPEELVARIQVHLRHATRYKRLLRASLFDELTDVFNRRGIIGVLEREIAVARSNTSPLSVLLVDVDEFKSINDHFGHVAGDHALQGVATALVDRIRGTDEVGRLGGDEFLVVAPATGVPECHTLISRLSIELSISIDGDRQLPLTFSLGGATLRPEDSVDDLINRADSAMYRDKRFRPAFGAARRRPRATPVDARLRDDVGRER